MNKRSIRFNISISIIVILAFISSIISLFCVNFRSTTVTCGNSIDGSSSLQFSGRNFYVDRKGENLYKESLVIFYQRCNRQLLNDEIGLKVNQTFFAKDSNNFIYSLFFSPIDSSYSNYMINCYGFYSEFNDNSDYLCYLPSSISYSEEKEYFYGFPYLYGLDFEKIFQCIFNHPNPAFTSIGNNQFELKIYSKSQKKYLNDKIVRLELKENSYTTKVVNK